MNPGLHSGILAGFPFTLGDNLGVNPYDTMGGPPRRRDPIVTVQRFRDRV
jgi:hypothetical protein